MIKSFECHEIEKSFDGIRAIAGLRLRLPPAGISGIIGPNGAGKTTLLNILTGFLRPDGGKCFFGDREITGLAPYQIARLGVARTFQDLRVILQMSVLDNVLLAFPNQRGEGLLNALFHGRIAVEEARNRAEARRLLEFVGLEGSESSLARELSYGQQKLLTLACCLATGARMLLLDEPVAGVHPEMAARILDMLRELRDGGKVIAFIEHDIDAVRKIADHIIVMDEGNIIAEGIPLEVLERPEIMEAYLA